METSLPTPMTARVYVNLPEGNLYNKQKNGTDSFNILKKH